MDRLTGQPALPGGRILRSCVCDRTLHTYTVSPGVKWRPEGKYRLLPKACCRCPPDCLCHGGGE